MTPDQWWAQVIHRSLSPVLNAAGPAATPSGPTIASALIRHFATAAAYDTHEDAVELLRALKRQKQSPHADFKPVVGIVSNFDPRLRSILSSLGLSLAPPSGPWSAEHDVDFVLASYDVGAHKPAPAVFAAAETLATRLLPVEQRGAPLLKVHVGDSRECDADAAVAVGWHGVLVDRDSATLEPAGGSRSSKAGLEYTDEPPPAALHELASLAPWNPCLLRNLADVPLVTES
jgi:FMN phosphatase YigB (HAD superfamily)